MQPDLSAKATFGNGVAVLHQGVAILLVGGERGEVDESEREVGGAGDLGGQVVADEFATTAADGLGPGARVLLEIGKLLNVECVADAERQHDDLAFVNASDEEWQKDSVSVEMSCSRLA